MLIVCYNPDGTILIEKLFNLNIKATRVDRLVCNFSIGITLRVWCTCLLLSALIMKIT